MKLQSRSLGINRLLGRRPRSDAASTDVANLPSTSTNLQSLAAELQQSALQGEFEYPDNWVLVVKTFSTLLVILSVTHAALVLMTQMVVLHGGLASIFNWTTLGGLLGIAAAGMVAALLLNIFPTLKVTPEGLGISELTGWRYIPWNQITLLRVMELRNKSRYALLIPFTGNTNPSTPAPMLAILPVLAGAAGWGGQGVLVTSDLKNFDRLVQLIVSYVVQASGQNPNSVPLEAYVDEDAIMPIAQLFLDPETEISRIASSPGTHTELYGISGDIVDPPVAWAPALKRQLVIAAVPVFVLLTDVLMRNVDRPLMREHWAWAVGLLALGMIELPFVAMLVRAVGELMVGSGHYNRTISAYLELQVPRTLLILVGGSLLALGVPAPFALALWFAGITITTFLMVRYVQRLYYMPITHTLLAALGTFIFQFSLLALYFAVR